MQIVAKALTLLPLALMLLLSVGAVLSLAARAGDPEPRAVMADLQQAVHAAVASGHAVGVHERIPSALRIEASGRTLSVSDGRVTAECQLPLPVEPFDAEYASAVDLNVSVAGGTVEFR
ncbi:MAG: hypothetical protein JRN39_05900 [Nitrososphaerota archaeon]|nr:hypothetical protein [Nitrososphaerota archaeon]MDG6939914.1 hypothetical protein [Nitrososphaerota archaeon]